MLKRVELSRYLVTLYALLHDVGKPIRRYLVRYKNGLEGEIKEFMDQIIKVGVKGGTIRSHDEISDSIISILIGVLPRPDVKEAILRIVKEVDPLAAIERGIYTRSWFKDIAERIQNLYKSLAGKYDPNSTPMITPLWILDIADYKTGPCTPIRDLIDNIKNTLLVKIFSKIDEGDGEGTIKYLSELVKSKRFFDKDKNYWLPVKSLSRDTILRLKLKPYDKAVNDVNYRAVVYDLISDLLKVKDLFDIRGTKDIDVGILDTILNVLKKSTFLVPSAVYGTILPDISLYSHSKYVAGLANAEFYKPNSYRLVSIDINGIQKFISLVIKVGAASKILRGRSLLVELIQDSISRLTLKVFNNLDESSIFISEGGVITLLVPNIKDFEDKFVRNIRNILIKASINEFKLDLGFTISYSKEFSKEDCNYLKSIVTGRGFIEVNDSLSISMARSKAIRNSLTLEHLGKRVIIVPDMIKEFDSSNKTLILKDEPYSICYDEDIEYLESLAPGKFSQGECLDSLNHRALVLGHVARNLMGIVGIYMYEVSGDGIIPAKDHIRELSRELSKCFGRHSGVAEDKAIHRLFFEFVVSEIGKMRLGIIPLPSLGTVYIAISNVETLKHDVKSWMKYWTLIAYVIREITSLIRNYLKSRNNSLSVSIRVKIVNYPEYFLPMGDVKDIIKKCIRNVRDANGDIGFEFMFTNTYHPVVNDGGIRFLDIEELSLLGVAKVDADRLGDVKRLYSLSPSRLATLSELLNIAFGAKTYLHLVDKAEKLGRFNVVILYGGGDDVAFYGEWSDVIEFAKDVIIEITRKLLAPLTVSSGIILERVKVPILETYKDAVINYLEGKAKSLRNSIAINLDVRRPGPCGLVGILPPYKGAWGKEDDWDFEALSRLSLVFRNPKEFLRLSIPMRVLYTLATLASKASEVLSATESTASLLKKAEILISYAQLWARSPSRENLEKLNEFLDKVIKHKLPEYPSAGVKGDEVINTLAKASPLLNTLILALRLSLRT